MHRVACCALVGVVFGCGAGQPGRAGAACVAASDCAGGLACVASVCTAAAAPSAMKMAMDGAVEGKRSLDAFEALAEDPPEAAAGAVRSLQKAGEQYLVHKGDACPTSMADLVAAGLVARALKDPWGEEYRFVCPGAKGPIDVTSLGPDRKPGGGDDIVSGDPKTP